MKSKQTLFILIVLLFKTVDTLACSCGDLDPFSKDVFDKADEIFIGRVIKVEEDRDNWMKAVTFQVTDRLKSTGQTKKITVWTAFDGAACGLSTEAGDEWYIFAYKNVDNKFVAGLCGRSVNLDKKFRVKDYGLRYAYLSKRAWKKDFNRYKKEKRFIKKELLHPTTKL